MAVVFTTLDVPVAAEVCFRRSIRSKLLARSALEEFLPLLCDSLEPVPDCLPLWLDPFVC